MECGGRVGGLRGSGVEAEGVLGASVWGEWYRQYPSSILPQGIFQEQNRPQGNYVQYLDV